MTEFKEGDVVRLTQNELSTDGSHAVKTRDGYEIRDDVDKRRNYDNSQKFVYRGVREGNYHYFEDEEGIVVVLRGDKFELYEEQENYPHSPRSIPVRLEEIMDLLAKEKIGILGRVNIPIKAGSTPRTDGKTIILPGRVDRVEIVDEKSYEKAKKDPAYNPNTTVQIGGLYHESSHIKYGSFLVNFSKYLNKRFTNPLLAKHLLNIIEDVRVEHLFNMEYAQDKRRITPLLETTLHYIQNTDITRITDEASLFIILLGQKAIGGFTTGQINKDYAQHEESLMSNKKILRLFNQALTIIERIRDPHATIADSLRLTEELYKIITKKFGHEIDIANDIDISPNHNYDQGPIKIDNPNDLEKYEETIKDGTERMQDAFDTDHQKIRENNDEYQRGKPEESSGDEIETERLIDRIKKSIKEMREGKKKSEPEKGKTQKREYSPVQEFVKKGLKKKGYSDGEAAKIAGEVDL